jgi:hypothetical protein
MICSPARLPYFYSGEVFSYHFSPRGARPSNSMTSISKTHISANNPIFLSNDVPFFFSSYLPPFQQSKFTICLTDLWACFLFKTAAGP